MNSDLVKQPVVPKAAKKLTTFNQNVELNSKIARMGPCRKHRTNTQLQLLECRSTK